jgi:hypothetical protein
MWRILSKYNEANANREIELKEIEIIMRKDNYKEKLKLCKQNLIKNKIEDDLLHRMKNDYLTKTNYNDYVNSSQEIKDIYEGIYKKIFDIQKDQKQLKKEYEELLYLSNL